MTVFKSEFSYNRGSIMLVVLMLFLLVSFLGIATLEIGLMEFKSSHYAAEMQQAQQAVDAGIDWGLENIYAELTLPANLIAESLPSPLLFGNQTTYLDVDGKTCEASIGEVIKLTEQRDDISLCTYNFTSTGLFGGACQKATIEVTYYFTGGYQYANSDGSISFMPRQYLNRGEVNYYQKTI